MEKHSCCCGGNKGNEFEKLDAILEKYRESKGTLIPILQEVQNVYGYLSKEVLIHIAQKTQIPISQIYGVATFYSQFHLNPRGKHIIRVCQGTACHVRGGAKILAALEELLEVNAGETTRDLNFTLETVACIGACGLAPVLTVNEEVYGRLTVDDVDGILEKYGFSK